jgi:hypothetical protein
VKFIITIDTEADNQWGPALSQETENLRFIPRFQALCDRYRFPPTYLCTYEVAAAPAFGEILLPLHASGRAEIGAHLHPWTTPPFSRWDRGQSAPAYPSELPLGVFARKLESLTGLLASKTGSRPRSYRAGRWGLSAAHIPLLIEHGYIVDCSVTPLVRWTDRGARECGQDFTSAPVTPYFMAWGDPAREGTSSLLEVPVTILHTNALMRRSPLLQGVYRRSRRRTVARLLNRSFVIAPQWFRPFSDMSVARLRSVFETAGRLSLPVIEMMFHSSELMPKGSPHSPNEAAVEHLFERLEGTFALLAREGVEGTTLASFAQPISRERAASVPPDELGWTAGRPGVDQSA